MDGRAASPSIGPMRNRDRGGGLHGQRERRDQARYLGHQTLNHFFLRDLDEERRVGDMLAARTSYNACRAGFRGCSGTENSSSGGGEVRGLLLQVTNLAREASMRRLNGSGRLGQWQIGFVD
jgi:hypothetical protein